MTYCWNLHLSIGVRVIDIKRFFVYLFLSCRRDIRIPEWLQPRHKSWHAEFAQTNVLLYNRWRRIVHTMFVLFNTVALTNQLTKFAFRINDRSRWSISNLSHRTGYFLLDNTNSLYADLWSLEMLLESRTIRRRYHKVKKDFVHSAKLNKENKEKKIFLFQR